MNASYVIKSKISERLFEEIVYKWLIEGDYTPDDITENIITEKNNKILFPLYYFIHNYSGSCNATIGFMRPVPHTYYDHHKQRHVNDTRMETYWQSHYQQVQGTVNTIIHAGGTIHPTKAGFVECTYWKADELIEMGRNFPYRAELMSLYKYSEKDCWENNGKKKAYDEAVGQTKLPSALVNSISLVDMKYTQITCVSVLVPYWMFNYSYQGENYFVLVDGNNPERIHGIKPEDQERINTVARLQSLGWLAGLSTIVSILYFTSGSFSDIDLTLGNTGIVTGGLFMTWAIVKLAVKSVKSRSRKTRTELLNRLFNRAELATS